MAGEAHPKTLSVPLDCSLSVFSPNSEYARRASQLAKLSSHFLFWGAESTVGIHTQLKKGLRGECSIHSSIQGSL